MPGFTDDFIRKVTDATDIVSLISTHTALTKKGSRYTGLCPFHSEKTPSFSVDAAKQLYYCFGCHEGGGAVKFVMSYYKYTFPEAIEFLAARAGLEPEYTSDYKPNAQAYVKKKVIYEINKEAANAYYKNFVKDSSALEYVHSRGISNASIKTFGIGLSYSSGSRMYDYLIKKGYKSEDIIEADLAMKNDNGIVDTFRSRLMFPILDVSNNIVGFGGRIIGDGFPKYRNTRENSVFIKNKLLFNLGRAKSNLIDGVLLLVEGYMDVIGLYDKGIKNACASLGTAFGENHANILKRYSDNIVIAYDGDEPGRAAAQRASEIFEKTGVSPRVLVLPREHDPDSFVKQYGKDEFLKLVNNSAYALDFGLKRLEESHDLTDLNERSRFLNEACAMVASTKDDFKREHYANYLARLTSADVMLIRKNIEKGEKFTDNTQFHEEASEISTEDFTRDAMFLPQASLLKFVLQGRDFYKCFTDAGGGELLFEGEMKELYNAIESEYSRNSEVDIAKELVYNNKVTQSLAAVSSSPAVIPAANELSSYLKKLKIKAYEDELRDLKKRIESARQNGTEEADLLLKEYGYMKNMLLKMKSEVY